MALTVVPAFLAILSFSPLVRAQQSSAPAKEQKCPEAWKITPAKPKLAEKTDAWVSENGAEDGVVLLQYCAVYQIGLSTLTRLAVASLKQLPPELEPYKKHAPKLIRIDDLPLGFSLYRDLAFELRTMGAQTGLSVTLRLPSVKTKNEFTKLFLLYLGEDPFVAGAMQWQNFDGLLSPQEHDFETRTLTAEFDLTRVFNRATGVGRLVVASFNEEQYEKSALDLFIASAVGPPSVKLGDTFTHRISIKNLSRTGGSASNVALYSSLSGGQFVSGTTTQGSCRQSLTTTGDAVCELGRVDHGQVVTITLIIKSDDSGMGRPDIKEFEFFSSNTVRSREKDSNQANNYYQSKGTIVRR